jgi:hypothetical protein
MKHTSSLNSRLHFIHLFNSEAGKSAWAYLPVGPLERQNGRVARGEIGEEVPKNPQERVALLWWDILGKPLLITLIDAGLRKRLWGFATKTKKKKIFSKKSEKAETRAVSPRLSLPNSFLI